VLYAADGEKVCKVLVYDAFNGDLAASRETDFGLKAAAGTNFEATTENSLTVRPLILCHRSCVARFR
jgi:hypothetical protein